MTDDKDNRAIDQLVDIETLVERIEMLEEDCTGGKEKKLCELPVIRSIEAFPFVPMLKHEQDQWSIDYNASRRDVCEVLHDVFFRWRCKYKNFHKEGWLQLNPANFLAAVRGKEDCVYAGSDETVGHVPMFRWYTWLYLPLFLRH